MPKALITVQEEQISKDQIRQLDEIVKGHYEKYVSKQKLTTIWCRVPPGQAYTKYKPSESSLLTIECESGFPQQKRISFLTNLEKNWRKVTGQSSDNVMLALIEEDLFGTVLESNRNRLSKKGRRRMSLHVVKAILKALVTRKPITFTPNIR